MLGGVPPGRLIAAADVAALLAEPEMHPAAAGLEALLTPIRRPGSDVTHFNQVLAFLDHGVPVRAIGYWLFPLTSHFSPLTSPHTGLAMWACTKPTAIAPSPTAAATRLAEPARTSPAANTPGRLVSSK